MRRANAARPGWPTTDSTVPIAKKTTLGRSESPRINRLVTPRFVPKSNKTQSILMMVGLGVVVIVVLLVVIMAGKNNPFRSNRDSSETSTDDELNFVFRRFDKSWVDDKGTQSRMKVSGFVRKRSDPDAWILVHAKDFGKTSPRPNEMRTAMNEMLRKGFRSLDPPVTVPQAAFAGQPAAAIEFAGENEGKQIRGEGFAFDYRGIGYIILYWSQVESWDSVKSEIDEYVKSFQFAGPREKWQDSGGAIEKFFVDGGNYQLEDVDAVWERGAELPKDDGDKKAPQPKKNSYVFEDIKDKDPKATMAFRLKEKSKSNPPPETIVVVLDQGNDPLEVVRAYWLKKLEEDDGAEGRLVKITLGKGKLPPGATIPKSEASVDVFELENSADRKGKRFYAIAAMNIGDKVIGAVSWCPDREADFIGPMMLNFVASLRERK